MTDTTTLAPTDADIEELLISCGMCWAERSFWQIEDADLHPAIRAVLAKWGAPATASGEAMSPFGYFRAEPFGWTDCAESDEGAKPLYESPPPAQEARVPIDPKVVGDLWLKSQGVCLTFCRLLEAEHGITAAQKETPCAPTPSL